MKYFFWLLFLLLLIFSRFWNIERTARFVWDESSDLVRMFDIYQNRRLTLVGPISEDNIKVFGSLSYYMTLPFVVWGGFSPVSAVWATAFFGIMTVLLLFLLLKNEKVGWFWMATLGLVYYPLLSSARWAWNPHFIPFFVVLGYLVYKKISCLLGWLLG